MSSPCFMLCTAKPLILFPAPRLSMLPERSLLTRKTRTSSSTRCLMTGKRISGFAVHGIKQGLLIHSLLANFVEFKFVSIIDNSDIMISMHMGFTSMGKVVDHVEAKVSLGLKGKIVLAFNWIPLWGNGLVDGEDIRSVDSIELVFSIELSIKDDLILIRHLVQEDILVD